MNITETEITKKQNTPEEEEKNLILKEYKKLRRAVAPKLKDNDSKMILKAFKVAQKAHQDMRRKSGEPFILHPIAVARIVLEEIGLGPTAVVAALLHDVVEDTEWTNEDIRREFGEKVAILVAGLTKIPSTKNFDFNQTVSEQAQNFRKMFLTLSDDPRIIEIKLADRLHNMRTLDSMERRKQLKIASETIYIYAPVAHRLGLYNIKSELEDLWLKHTKREEYEHIAHKLSISRKQRNSFIEEFIEPLKKTLVEHDYRARVFGRPKSIYSIWKKMQKQQIPFEEIYDLFAIRIVLDLDEDQDEKGECWRVYSFVTDYYRPNTKRLRDWISNPRPNGYESLHTTVMTSQGKWVEVQIRSERMDEIAERGYAAHWKYKEQRKQDSNQKTETGLDTWINNIKELRERDDLSAMEFIEEVKANFQQEEIFVFTPKNELKKLPTGSTILDFAFYIHSEVGYSCLGAKVNHKLVPLDFELSNGDRVEIITSKKAQPNSGWLNLVKTSRAKAKINNLLRSEKKEAIVEGKNIVRKKFKQFELEDSDLQINELMKFLDYRNRSNMFYNIGKGHISTKQINAFQKWKIHKEKVREEKLAKKNTAQELRAKEEIDVKRDILLIGTDTKILHTLAKCCNPVPGDDVFGFITASDGVKIHRTDCPNATFIMANYGQKIMKVAWSTKKEDLFLADLKITGNDRMGLLSEVTNILSFNLKINITAMSIEIREGSLFEGRIKLKVHDRKHLENILEKLKRVEGVHRIDRFDER